ncbi:MAG: transcription-repair coupling factor [Acutalibacteraceae bacterium]|nr:transcription-repair coupling factor [Acutalibacteraceae bacterium]
MSCFTKALKGLNEYRSIIYDLNNRRLPAGVVGLSAIHKAHVISAACEDLAPHRAIIITPDEAQASKLCKDLNAFGCEAQLYPAGDITLRPDNVKSREYEHKRLSVLGNLVDGKVRAVVCSVEAALQYTIPPEELIAKRITLNVDDEIKQDELVEILINAGYTRSAQVDGSGQFSVRGGIIDIFSPDCENPYRIEFWGDNIDCLSTFEVESQRRIDSTRSITITPTNEICCSPVRLIELLEDFMKNAKGKGTNKVKESIRLDLEKLEGGINLPNIDRYLPLVYPYPATIFDYIEQPLVFVTESFSVKESANACLKIFHEDLKAYLEDGIICNGLDKYMMEFSELLTLYEDLGAIYLDNMTRGSFDTPVKSLVTFNAKQFSPWSGSLSVLIDDIRPVYGKKGNSVFVIAGTEKTAKALASDLENEGIAATFLATPPEECVPGKVIVLPGGFSAGFEYPDAKLTVITYGSKASLPVRKSSKKVKKANMFNSLEDLHKGDYIVHIAHGIGLFDGITSLEADGKIKDYIKIRYDKGDVLYVPVTQLDQVSKYIGARSENGTVKLNKLGGKEWQKTRSRVRSAVKDIAKELIELYAKRTQIKGHAFSPDIDMQNDFERRFEFDETEDQLRCIFEIKEDMEKPYPMDRLLCGDVGFGKTEVALRAAFKCVADSKQCAILVPTTILALQHYQTICKRFEGFPIEAQMISRFVPATQQKKIKEQLKSGFVDIIVGTHRLISKDIEFKNLGLIIVDEEQRFGVAQKEKLKENYPDIDVLTLSATPIPRTLNMAMSGIRDMSILEEAPHDRHPVQTYVVEYNFEVILQAIHSELRRGGQVYYLHNRTETIERTAAKLKEFLPDHNVAVAHGQMSEDQLSDIWRRLLEGEIDVLVCTTIIETGVDVPNVNTIIIEDADRLGLAQLHQIRGRVGRSARRASAYLTFRRGKELTEIASKRLTAIREYTEFGSGFHIAMRDLEIRGAGNILGAQQHGHMEAVGYDMYLKMLEQAVSEEKGEAPAVSEKECLIDLPIDAHIPSDYIENVPHKLKMYRRIADIKNQDDADDVIDELIDRFGEPPQCVMGLITVSLLRNTALSQGVYEIGRTGNNVKLFIEALQMEKISLLAKYMPGRITVSAAGKPHIAIKVNVGEDQLAVIRKALDIMAKTENQ